MPLLTKIEEIDAALHEDAKAASAHHENYAIILQRMANRLLTLPPETLEEWLNSREAKGTLGQLFTAHYLAGEGLNALAFVVGPMVGRDPNPEKSPPDPNPLPLVDTSPVSAKAAARNLSITADETGWHVTTITQPEPEPQPE